MKKLPLLLFIGLISVSAFGQNDRQQLDDTETAFISTLASRGQKAAFLSVLADDAVMFHNGPTRARDYWTGRQDSPLLLTRTQAFSDVSSNGQLGYTTGSWRTATREKDPVYKYGEYVTIWERRQKTGFRVVLDMVTIHPPYQPGEVKKMSISPNRSVDVNKKGYSATNSAMRFLGLGAGGGNLATAYEFSSQDDVRLIVDFLPPILGKKRVLTEAKEYKSLIVPSNLAIYQSGDMAYFWHPCSYDNSVEGTENGNCLHIMKLRKKQWWIVFSMFARQESEAPPVLRTKEGDSSKKPPVH
ncbi:MAG: hypothetical protein JO053_01360 [Acidobacteria bacterium]|nr:hypothetical protein [Acidobacteriota bacterium]